MLPSPRWPNGTGRAPGTSASTAASASARNSGTWASGTETSCRSFGRKPTQPPKPLALAEAFRDGRVGDEAGLGARRQRVFERLAQAMVLARRQLEQDHGLREALED